MSYSQIFKRDLELDFILDYIKNNLILVKNTSSSTLQSVDVSNDSVEDKQISTVDTCVYLLNKVAYKKIKFHNNIHVLTDYLKDKYYPSKVGKYIVENMCYKKFVTIFRQCCKYLKINIDSKIRYSNSTYEMTYYVTI